MWAQRSDIKLNVLQQRYIRNAKLGARRTLYVKQTSPLLRPRLLRPHLLPAELFLRVDAHFVCHYEWIPRLQTQARGRMRNCHPPELARENAHVAIGSGQPTLSPNTGPCTTAEFLLSRRKSCHLKKTSSHYEENPRICKEVLTLLGQHDLSNATCMIRPRLFSAALLL